MEEMNDDGRLNFYKYYQRKYSGLALETDVLSIWETGKEGGDRETGRER